MTLLMPIYMFRPSIIIDDENCPLTDEQLELVANTQYHLQLLLQRSEISKGAYERLMTEMEKVLPVSPEKRRARVRRLRNYIRQGQQKRDERLFDELKEMNEGMAQDLQDNYWERSVIQQDHNDEERFDADGVDIGISSSDDEEVVTQNLASRITLDSSDLKDILAKQIGSGESITVSGGDMAAAARLAAASYDDQKLQRQSMRGKLRRMNTITAKELRAMKRDISLQKRPTAAKVGYEIVNTKAELSLADSNHPRNKGKATAQAVPLGHEEHAAQERAKAKEEWDKEQAAIIAEQRAVSTKLLRDGFLLVLFTMYTRTNQ